MQSGEIHIAARKPAVRLLIPVVLADRFRSASWQRRSTKRPSPLPDREYVPLAVEPAAFRALFGDVRQTIEVKQRWFHSGLVVRERFRIPDRTLAHLTDVVFLPQRDCASRRFPR